MKEKQRSLRVLLIEDHKIVRQGLRSLLERQADIEIVGEAGDGVEGVALAERTQPDIVVLDLGLPRCNGIDAAKLLCEQVPKAGIVVLSMHAGEEYVRPAIRAGVRGYLLKGSGLSDLICAIHAVARGEAFFSPGVAQILVQDAQSPHVHKKKTHLTPREQEILQLIAEGHSSPQIAELLSISPRTVEGHRGRIMKKLDIPHVVGLVRYAIKNGLVQI